MEPIDHNRDHTEPLPPASPQRAEQPWINPAYQSPPPPAPKPSKRSTLGWIVSRMVIGLVVFSLLFMTFAGGMLFQRFVINDGASATRTVPVNAPGPTLFREAWNTIQDNYVDVPAIDDEQMLKAAIDGMVSTLNDEGHTRYMTAAEARASVENLQGRFFGVGIQMSERDGEIVVVAPLDDSPAQEAGILPGDVLIEVNGESIAGRSISDVVNIVRGDENTQVSLTFRRGETNTTYDLIRREIVSSSVAWVMLPDNIALLRLSQFISGSSDQLMEALAEAKQEGAVGIILDLRNNPGGYVHEAMAIASMFIDEGKVVFISQFRDGTKEDHLSTRARVSSGDMPLVVLINEGSASSSEIVSGAIKANNPHATLIGETTFGTGTVLRQFDLTDGSALLVGTELWLDASGEVIRHHGVRPDVLVALPDDQMPFVPVRNGINDVDNIKDFQIEWARHVISSGQAGDDAPTYEVTPTPAP